jgi:hypothetical protein
MAATASWPRLASGFAFVDARAKAGHDAPGGCPKSLRR